jgi:hypothetical protein
LACGRIITQINQWRPSGWHTFAVLRFHDINDMFVSGQSVLKVLDTLAMSLCRFEHPFPRI